MKLRPSQLFYQCECFHIEGTSQFIQNLDRRIASGSLQIADVGSMDFRLVRKLLLWETLFLGAMIVWRFAGPERALHITSVVATVIAR